MLLMFIIMYVGNVHTNMNTNFVSVLYVNNKKCVTKRIFGSNMTLNTISDIIHTCTILLYIFVKLTEV